MASAVMFHKKHTKPAAPLRRHFSSWGNKHTSEVTMDYPMHPDLKVGNEFPDFELQDQDGKPRRLSKLIRGFPTVLIFSRGYY